jgi:hypothetical protein
MRAFNVSSPGQTASGEFTGEFTGVSRVTSRGNVLRCIHGAGLGDGIPRGVLSVVSSDLAEDRPSVINEALPSVAYLAYMLAVGVLVGFALVSFIDRSEVSSASIMQVAK